MSVIGQEASQRWADCAALNEFLLESLCRLPHCQLLYAINTDGTQYSGNITRNGIDNNWQGRDLSRRPYFSGNLPYRGLLLSAVYLSQRSMQPCITTLQAVQHNGQLCGFIAADFHIKDLPITNTHTLQRMHQQNSQHHPANGLGTKLSLAAKTHMDENIDYLIYILSSLMHEHGVFHCKLHFAAERCNLWSYQDPLHYRLHTIDEIMSNDLLEQYPQTDDYNPRNTVNPEQIPLIFAQLKALRQADDRIYLTSGSLNLVNGLLSLTFSGEGTHYIHVDDFLSQDLGYWLNDKESPQHTDIIQNSSAN